MRNVLLVLCAGLLASTAVAAPPNANALPNLNWHALLVSQTAAAPPQQQQIVPPPPPGEEPVPPAEEPAPAVALEYKGVNEFFNVREAYSDVLARQWEFGVGFNWRTFYNENQRKDDVILSQVIKYGITDSLHVALTIYEPLGYGGSSIPDTELTVFNTFWKEGDWYPALAGYAKLWMPTGYESEGVDGTYGAVLTKTLFPRFRVHMEGWVKNACGEAGYLGDIWSASHVDRRDFQWGVGPGVDYQMFDNALVVVNYLHRSSETEGSGNIQVIEAGLVYKFGESERSYHQIKGAADVGLCEQRDTPHLGAKLQYEFYLK
ncbi:MAG: hypothetical protein AB1716_16245 [Planctomycetota bacterium]